MTDQGRSALEARLHATDEYCEHFDVGPNGERPWNQCEHRAAAILGEHGLFIADASKHEPQIENDYGDCTLSCSCGWSSGGQIGHGHTESGSYFDHIVGAP